MNIDEMRLSIKNYDLETSTLKRLLEKAPRTSSAFQNWCKKSADKMPLTKTLRYPDLKVGGDWHTSPPVRYTSVLALMVALGRVIKSETPTGAMYEIPTGRD